MNGFTRPNSLLRHAFGALAILAVQGHAGAAGQVAPGGSMPEALKGIRQASSVCRIADVPTAAAADIAARPDMRSAVDVGAVQQRLQRADTVLIDVRPIADYDAFHIGGAIHATLADLHSKPYWRGKTALLVGNGKAERELYAECSRLKQMGYKEVGVVRGGMPAWLAAGQPVAGQAPAASQLARLSAAEFWLESQSRENLVVLGKDQAALQADLGGAVVLPQLNATSVRNALKQRAGASRNAPLAALVVMAEASQEPQLEQIRQAVTPLPVLAYTDTRDAFAKHMVVQKAIWKAQATGPKQPACGQ